MWLLRSCTSKISRSNRLSGLEDAALHFEKALYEDPHRDLNALWCSDKERFQQLKFVGDFENTETPGEKFLVQILVRCSAPSRSA